MNPIILAIDTSCDETSVAVTQGMKVLSNVIMSQARIHAPFGGVYPSLAKREHLSKIHYAIHIAEKRARKKIQAVAVTFGPGLPPALEVGISTAKHYALNHSLPLIPVDHIEGHIYSAFVQNSNGNPLRVITYPFLSFIVSGGHTLLVHVTAPLSYTILGETLDDAAGEALDKGARMFHLGYPGGPALERVAIQGTINKKLFTIPLIGKKTLNFSFSGLKTALRREVEKIPQGLLAHKVPHLAASYQETVITSLINTLDRALGLYPSSICTLGGGVSANKVLLKRFRAVTRVHTCKGLTPAKAYLHTDNAAMIGAVAGKFHQKITLYSSDINKLDRSPRADLTEYVAHGQPQPTH